MPRQFSAVTLNGTAFTDRDFTDGITGSPLNAGTEYTDAL